MGTIRRGFLLALGAMLATAVVGVFVLAVVAVAVGLFAQRG